jgi:prolyl-tRNA synthetase
MDATYRTMYEAYGRIFTRLGLGFRAVAADSGSIGGDVSHEFQVLADSGEDAIAFSDQSDYAANVELAEAVAPPGSRPAPAQPLARVDTPTQKTIEEVSAFLEVPPSRCVKTLLVRGTEGVVALCLRGDHEVNEVKAAKLPELPGESVLASEAEIRAATGASPGFIGPIGLPDDIPVIVDRAAAALADFVCGGNRDGTHYTGANWERDARITRIADLRKVVAGDPSPDGHGTLVIARGIEVGHIFQNGDKYTRTLGVTVLGEDGRDQTPVTGCYGIGITRIVAAAIEQNHDEHGIAWPEPMAPWRVVICVINPKGNPDVNQAAESLYAELNARGIETALDDRGLRPGAMFADLELIGIPHRIVVSERGLAAGTFEYRGRRDSESRNLDRAALLERFPVSNG